VETKHLLHHAALFARTRWTNVYFKPDIIGGSLIPVLGTGMKDVSLSADTDAGKGLAAHVMYWDSRGKAACAALKDARGLCEVKEILHG
jgi:hypothetical protein